MPKAAAITVIFLSVLSILLLNLLGLLIPFTIGVSAIFVPIPVLILILSYFVSRRLVKNQTLAATNPKLAGYLRACFVINRVFMWLFLGGLAFGGVAILIGGIIGLLVKK